MAQPKERSTFWVVSTHVLTTGFVFPLLAGVVASFIPQVSPGLDPWVVVAMTLGLGALAYLGGTYYSLGYIRKSAIVRDPIACITPSIITFAVLEALGFAFYAYTRHDAIFLGVLAAYYVAIGLIFAFVTREGFRKMTRSSAGFPVQPTTPNWPSPPPPAK
jgi:hypothetical protein